MVRLSPARAGAFAAPSHVVFRKRCRLLQGTPQDMVARHSRRGDRRKDEDEDAAEVAGTMQMLPLLTRAQRQMYQ